MMGQNLKSFISGSAKSSPKTQEVLFMFTGGLLLITTFLILIVSYNEQVLKIENDKLTAQVSGSCIDSDGGISPYTKGTVSYSGQFYTDSCYTETTVYEYSCAVYPSSGVTHTFQNCPSGYSCANGACIASTPLPTTTSCYLSFDLNETATTNGVSLSLQGGLAQYGDFSGEVRKYYPDEGNDYTLSVYGDTNQLLSQYELFSSRFTIVDYATGGGTVIESPSGTLTAYIPYSSSVRKLVIDQQGTATTTIPVNTSTWICR